MRRRESISWSRFLVFSLMSAAVAFGQTADTTPPRLVEFDFTSRQVEVSLGHRDIDVTMRVTDDLSGLTYAYMEFRSPSGQVQHVFPPRVSGTPFDGIYRGSVRIPRFAEAGLWTVNRVILGDRPNNFVTHDTTALRSSGFPVDLNVVSSTDIEPPRLTRLRFEPSTINVSC